MMEEVETLYRETPPRADFSSLRIVHQRSESLSARRNVVEPVRTGDDLGAMLTVIDGGGLGYAATSDLTDEGLRRAGEQALAWAGRTAGCSVARFDPPDDERAPRGSYRSRVQKPWSELPLARRIDMVREQCGDLEAEGIVDWGAAVISVEEDVLLLTADGGRVEQQFRYLIPDLHATANVGGESQTRTLGRGALGQQGGFEVLEESGFLTDAERIASQARELLDAPNCPSERCDVVLAADQVYIQIHESIGHPLELDRILGDERNFAGTSFVTQEMFGSYRYGSELLNVTFDPTRPEQFASYAFDDEGRPAVKEYIIRDGILQRPLGSGTSQARAGLDGVANARATSWNRPPIDRMANLNIEPGTSSLEGLIGSVEHGLYMQTNRSWSIDDSRNKFQFGCEWARRIDHGTLGEVVKNPNYRGISAEFWRSLDGVGDASTLRVLGTPHCGKGEPNQSIRVGHAAPACLFRQVDVFGGA